MSSRGPPNRSDVSYDSSGPADSTHHFGHGKVENLSAFLQTGLLLVTCIWIVGTLNSAPWATVVHPGIVGLGTAGLLMLAVTMFTPPVEDQAVNKYFAEAT